jgi:hypothetical protein
VQPPKRKQKRPAKKKPEAKTDEETEAEVYALSLSFLMWRLKPTCCRFVI